MLEIMASAQLVPGRRPVHLWQWPVGLAPDFEAMFSLACVVDLLCASVSIFPQEPQALDLGFIGVKIP